MTTPREWAEALAAELEAFTEDEAALVGHLAAALDKRGGQAVRADLSITPPTLGSSSDAAA